MTRATRTCGGCGHFVDDPARIEALIPGLTAMGSARASVRGDDGICGVHDRIVTARDWCDRFCARAENYGTRRKS
jgi:hypothetical protein